MFKLFVQTLEIISYFFVELTLCQRLSDRIIRYEDFPFNMFFQKINYLKKYFGACKVGNVTKKSFIKLIQSTSSESMNKHQLIIN